MLTTTLFVASAVLGLTAFVLGRRPNRSRRVGWLLGLAGFALVAAILLS